MTTRKRAAPQNEIGTGLGVLTPVPNELRSLDDLRPNPMNPREDWKPEQVESFTHSLGRFGDLGGIVRNLTTDHLVGGHKRVEVFRRAENVEVTTIPQEEDRQGTVAHGYVIVDGNRFAYREVRWTEEVETAANLAANRWAAEWQWQGVSEALKGISDLSLLGLTGFPDHELANLLAAEWNPAAVDALPTDHGHGHSVQLTPEQFAQLQAVKAVLGEPDRSDADTIEHLCARVLAEGA